MNESYFEPLEVTETKFRLFPDFQRAPVSYRSPRKGDLKSYAMECSSICQKAQAFRLDVLGSG